MFPAYARPGETGEQLIAAPASSLVEDEAMLLAGDSDEESGGGGDGQLASLPASPPEPQPAREPVTQPAAPEDFYEERRGERGNLRVSTLYYPGRPE